MKRRHAEKMIARKRRLMKEAQQQKIKEANELRAQMEDPMNQIHEVTSTLVEQNSSTVVTSEIVEVVPNPSSKLPSNDEGKREEMYVEKIPRRIKSLSESRETFENRSENQMKEHEGNPVLFEDVRDSVPSEFILADVHISPPRGDSVNDLKNINDEL